ncbi:MAG: hypothetical protein QW727_04535 [Candidatus Pacearchaeota archaeon]
MVNFFDIAVIIGVMALTFFIFMIYRIFFKPTSISIERDEQGRITNILYL